MPYLESLIRDGLGLARHRLGDQSLALRHLSRSLSLTRSCGIPHRTAGVLLTLAETLHASGDAERARSAYRSSLELYRGIGHPAAGFVGGRLSLL